MNFDLDSNTLLNYVVYIENVSNLCIQKEGYNNVSHKFLVIEAIHYNEFT